MESERRQFLRGGQMQLPQDLWAMKRSLDFIPKCDGKSLKGLKQRSDTTLFMFKKNHCGCSVDRRREWGGEKRAPGKPRCNNPGGRQARRASWARRCWWKWWEWSGLGYAWKVDHSYLLTDWIWGVREREVKNERERVTPRVFTY